VGIRKARAADTAAALKDAARRQFLEHGYLNTKITDITAAAGRATGSFYDHFSSKEDLLQALLADMRAQASADIGRQDRPADHPGDQRGDQRGDHELADREQLRAHLAVAWRVMRANLPVMAALYESSIAAGLGSGQAWQRLVEDTDMLREHLEYLAARGHRLPGEPTLVAAAMGGMLAMLGYALLPSPASGYSDDEIIDTVTTLLHSGLAGR
jgi:AcrR family transcriptional regulator